MSAPEFPAAAYDRWKTTPPEDDEPRFEDDGPDPDDLRDELYDRESVASVHYA